MDKPHEAVLLRVFTRTTDRSGLEPLYLAIVQKARAMDLAGATVLRGLLGFGQSDKVHRGRILPPAQELPVVVEVVDTEDKINAFLPILDEMMESGLVTLESTRFLRYHRHHAGLLERIKDHFSRHPHPA